MKYTASVLGAVWSLLNPIVFLAVFSFVATCSATAVPDFPVFLLSGLLAWNFVSNALQAGSRSVIDNANLVKKMAFPREILPLSSVGVALFDFALQSAVFLVFIGVSGHGFQLPELWLYPLALVVAGRVRHGPHAVDRRPQRALPGRGPPAEPRPARLVLGDADRVPGLARPAEARDDLDPGDRRVDPVPAEPGHGDRARVPDARSTAVAAPAPGEDPRPAGHEPSGADGCHARAARGLRSCSCSSRGDRSSDGPATSRRSCDDRDPDRGHLQDVPAVP